MLPRSRATGTCWWTCVFDLRALQEIRIADVEHWTSEAQRAELNLVVLPLCPGEEHLVGYFLRTGTLLTVLLHTPLPASRVHMATWHIDERPPIISMASQILVLYRKRT